MKLRHIALIGSLFPFLLAIVLFFGVLISAEDDDGGGGSSSWDVDAERDNWMSAQETLEYGFIDEIMANNQLK